MPTDRPKTGKAGGARKPAKKRAINLHPIADAIDKVLLKLGEIRKVAKNPKEVDRSIKALTKLHDKTTHECPQNFERFFEIKK